MTPRVDRYARVTVRMAHYSVPARLIGRRVKVFWALARRAPGDAGGTRAIVEVLLLHRHLAHGDVVTGLAAAVAVGSTSPDVVAVEARKAAQLRGASPTVAATAAAGALATADLAAAEPAAPARRDRVASLTERRLVEARDRADGLPADGRALPSVAHYDELLAHPPAAGTRGA